MALRCSMGVPECNPVTQMRLPTEVLLCKQTIDKSPIRPAPWHHLSGNRLLFVAHLISMKYFNLSKYYFKNFFEINVFTVVSFKHIKFVVRCTFVLTISSGTSVMADFNHVSRLFAKFLMA